MAKRGKKIAFTPAERQEQATLEANVVREEASEAREAKQTPVEAPEPVPEPTAPAAPSAVPEAPAVSEAPVEHTWWGGVKKQAE